MFVSSAVPISTSDSEKQEHATEGENTSNRDVPSSVVRSAVVRMQGEIQIGSSRGQKVKTVPVLLMAQGGKRQLKSLLDKISAHQTTLHIIKVG